MNNVKRERLRIGVTQIWLAERAGCARSYLCEIESNKRKLTLTMARKLSAVLHVPAFELLGTDAIKYAGTFFETLRALVEENYQSMTEGTEENPTDDRSAAIYFIVRDLLRDGVTIEDLKAVRQFVGLITAKCRT